MAKVRFLVAAGVVLSVIGLLSAAAMEEAVVDEGQSVSAPSEKPQESRRAEEANVVDANSFEARVERGWVEVDQAADSEARGWMELEMDKRSEVTRAAQRTTEAQLQLLRLLAESESATQTVAAIDKILEARSAKVQEVLDEAREAKRQERIKQREERRKALEEKRKSRREQMSQP